MKLGWLTDIHLNFLEESGLSTFLRTLASSPVDAWLVGGDIGEADSVVGFLREMEASTEVPIYFVLGNHDFYGESLAVVEAEIEQLSERSQNLIWLTSVGSQSLSPTVALVGDDSWADARLGDASRTQVEVNDFYLITDLANLSRVEKIEHLNGLGNRAAARLRPKLKQAASQHQRVLVLTHVPPFRESAWHEGKLSSNAWLPWFSCKAVGDVIVDCAASHPDCEFLVLCGHTHGAGVYRPMPNLTVRTAEAEYGSPEVQDVLDFTD